MKSPNSVYQYLIVGLLVIGTASLPVWGNGYLIRIGFNVIMFATLAMSWNLIGGMTGYPSFGHVGFFGLGAYTVGIAMTSIQLPFWLSLGLVVPASLIFAAVLYPILRLKSHYFAIATLVSAECIREAANLLGVTGGPNGIGLPLPEAGQFQTYLFFYETMLAVLLLVLLVSLWIKRHRLGLALVSIREDEDTAQTMGINTPRCKFYALAVSALFSALPGGIYAYWMSYIDPGSVFPISISVTMILMVLLGGAGTLFGPILGALLLEGIGNVLWSAFPELHMATLGMLIVVTVIYLPQGVLPSLGRFDRFIRKWRGHTVLSRNG